MAMVIVPCATAACISGELKLNMKYTGRNIVDGRPIDVMWLSIVSLLSINGTPVLKVAPAEL